MKPNITITQTPRRAAAPATAPSRPTAAPSRSPANRPATAAAPSPEALARARAEERQRIRVILNHEAAVGREDLACHLAFETSLSIEAAVGMLGKAPRAERPKAVNQVFLDLMAASGNPDVGPEAPNQPATDETGFRPGSGAALMKRQLGLAK